jgi:predicted ATPase
MLHVSHYSLGATLNNRGDIPSALSHLEQGLIHERMVTRSGRAEMPICRVLSTWALWECGYPDQAHQRSLEALSIVQEHARPFDKAWTIASLAFLSQYRREVAITHERADTALALAAEHGFTQVGGWATMFRGWALAMRGQLEEGCAQMRQGMDAVLATGSVQFRPYFLALVAEVLGNMGRAAEVVAKTEQHYWEAELYRLKGDLLLSLSPDNQAETETCFHQALDVARHQQAKSLELRAATSLARLWQSQGKRQDAYDLLAPVYGWFTEGFGTADLRETKGLLEELG